MASTAVWQRPTDSEALRLCSLLRQLSPASSSVASEAPYLRDAHRCQNQKRIIWSKLWGWDLVKIWSWILVKILRFFNTLPKPDTWYWRKKSTRCAMSGGDKISKNICLGYFQARYLFKIVSPQSANMGHFLKSCSRLIMFSIRKKRKAMYVICLSRIKERNAKCFVI